ncbi:MAG: hypothetical protein QOE74_5436 [Mycobacterium sp.]|jgi:hypothetical protein|nr:hypothetical protein [Mycobacterium sp.]
MQLPIDTTPPRLPSANEESPTPLITSLVVWQHGWVL